MTKCQCILTPSNIHNVNDGRVATIAVLVTVIDLRYVGIPTVRQECLVRAVRVFAAQNNVSQTMIVPRTLAQPPHKHSVQKHTYYSLTSIYAYIVGSQ